MLRELLEREFPGRCKIVKAQNRKHVGHKCKYDFVAAPAFVLRLVELVRIISGGLSEPVGPCVDDRIEGVSRYASSIFATQMFERIKRFRDRIFPEDVVLAVPGQIRADALRLPRAMTSRAFARSYFYRTVRNGVLKA
jgi:hypothetical protein